MEKLTVLSRGVSRLVAVRVNVVVRRFVIPDRGGIGGGRDPRGGGCGGARRTSLVDSRRGWRRTSGATPVIPVPVVPVSVVPVPVIAVSVVPVATRPVARPSAAEATPSTAFLEASFVRVRSLVSRRALNATAKRFWNYCKMLNSSHLHPKRPWLSITYS